MTDFFTLFYYKFIDGSGLSISTDNFWNRKMIEPSFISWQGLTFELICLKHIEQIKKSLGISGVHTEVSSCRSQQTNSENNKAQIDLISDRSDRCIHLCEMKFSRGEFSIGDAYAKRLRDRIQLFKDETGSRKSVHLTFMTTYGIKRNENAAIVQSEVTLDDLFIPMQLRALRARIVKPYD